ncbi:MAG: hypothetical protein ACK5MK_00685, partial [Dysgonomonas sp.]
MAKKVKIEEKIVFDFSFPTAFISLKEGDFTNYLKDQDELINKVKYVMDTIVPTTKQYTPSTLYQIGKHSHAITDKDKVDKIFDIVKQAYMKKQSATADAAKRFVDQNLKE